MKKITLSLLGFLLLAGSLFAVTLDEINSANPPYARAFITQIDIRDSGEAATKLNTVTYEYWDADYPYNTMRYNGTIDTWYYTFDYSTFYYYSSGWDAYIDPNDLSVTYIYVNLQGYSTSSISVERYDSATQTWNTTNITYYTTLTDGTRVYKSTSSAAINKYRVITTIQATDGTAYLHNNVTIDRDAQ